MADRLLAELERFAAALLEAQQTLLDILRRKRAALVTTDLPALEAAQLPETAAAQRLQALISWRDKLLDAARRAGHRGETLIELTRSLRSSQSSALIADLESAARLAAELQQESWVQWVITNRCCHFYDDVLEMISHHGKKPPTYQSADWIQRGGTVLNASA